MRTARAWILPPLPNSASLQIEVIGVFHVALVWKVYCRNGPSQSFDNREAAVATAKAKARTAVAAGILVELHVEDDHGDVHQIALTSFAH
jgi:hypothetical protein